MIPFRARPAMHFLLGLAIVAHCAPSGFRRAIYTDQDAAPQHGHEAGASSQPPTNVRESKPPVVEQRPQGGLNINCDVDVMLLYSSLPEDQKLAQDTLDQCRKCDCGPLQKPTLCPRPIAALHPATKLSYPNMKSGAFANWICQGDLPYKIHCACGTNKNKYYTANREWEKVFFPEAEGRVEGTALLNQKLVSQTSILPPGELPTCLATKPTMKTHAQYCEDGCMCNHGALFCNSDGLRTLGFYSQDEQQEVCRGQHAIWCDCPEEPN